MRNIQWFSVLLPLSHPGITPHSRTNLPQLLHTRQALHGHRHNPPSRTFSVPQLVLNNSHRDKHHPCSKGLGQSRGSSLGQFQGSSLGHCLDSSKCSSSRSHNHNHSSNRILTLGYQLLPSNSSKRLPNRGNRGMDSRRSPLHLWVDPAHLLHSLQTGWRI